MIKKTALLTLTAPFLMVFSVNSFASAYFTSDSNNAAGSFSSPNAICQESISVSNASMARQGYKDRYVFRGIHSYGNQTYGCKRALKYHDPYDPSSPYSHVQIVLTIRGNNCSGDSYCDALEANPDTLPLKTDEECQSELGSSVSVSPSHANTLSAGGKLSASGGSCSVSISSNPQAAFCYGDPVMCDMDIVSSSSNEFGFWNAQLDDGGQGTFSVLSFSANEYLQELPGGCSDPSSCVSIDGTSYLVDWDKAPDHFQYVGSDGNTYSKPSSGGGSGGDTGGGDPTDPTNPTDPTDPGGNDGGDSGGDSGDSDGGNDSGDGSGGSSGGGGSTVPEFEFDESGIIEAIRSSGQSNRNAINALSNDVTGSINNQTNELNNATSAQTDALSGALNTQTDTLTNSLNTQTDSVTSALDDQTGTLTGSLDALGTSIVDAINALGSGEGEGESDGEGTEEDGLLDGISNLFNGLVDDLASRFTEDLGNGDDLFNSSGLDNTLDNVAAEEQEYTDEIHTLMDEIGDGATSGIAEQVTSRLPSLPSGGCTPLQFGPMEISCQAFNTIKLWLTWIVYFWTVVSIVDTFFRSEQRTA